jgi:hypothetical protein
MLSINFTNFVAFADGIESVINSSPQSNVSLTEGKQRHIGHIIDAAKSATKLKLESGDVLNISCST